MICSACGAAIDRLSDFNSSQCSHCGFHCAAENLDSVTVVHAPGAVCCPLCQVPLIPTLIEEETVYQCSHCRGFLAEIENFRVIVAKRRTLHRANENSTDPFDPEELQRVLACPICHQRMDTHPYFGGGNVVVDTCESCNCIWLDAGELATIERYVPRIHQIEHTLTLRGGRYQGGPSDMPVL